MMRFLFETPDAVMFWFSIVLVFIIVFLTLLCVLLGSIDIVGVKK